MWRWHFHMYASMYTFRSFLALNSTHVISEASNLTITFVLTLLIIIVSFVDWVEVYLVHVMMRISHVYTNTHFIAFWLLILHSGASNLIWPPPKFHGQVTWSRCVPYMWGWGLHMYVNMYTFLSFLALNYTHIISEASNLTTTFVLTLLIIILSFKDRRHGWGVFRTSEDRIFTCTSMCTHFVPFWLLIPHTSSPKSQTCPTPLFWRY